MIDETFDRSPLQIPRYKWIEIEEEECKNHIINSIRDEIVHSAMEAVTKSYFINKSTSFVVDCAHVTWLQLFNWINLECDSGDDPTTIKNLWSDDGKQQYESVPPDSWIFGTVEIRKKTGSICEQKSCIKTCDQADVSCILPEPT